MTDVVVEVVPDTTVVETPSGTTVEVVDLVSEIDEINTADIAVEYITAPVEVVEVSTPGPQGATGPAGPMGLNIEAHPFGKVLTGVYVGPFRLGFNGPYVFESIDVWSDVAVTGSPLVLDVLKGGTTSLWANPSDRPTIAVGQLHAVMAGPPSLLTFVNGDFVTYSVPQFGSNSIINLQGNLRVRST